MHSSKKKLEFYLKVLCMGFRYFIKYLKQQNFNKLTSMKSNGYENLEGLSKQYRNKLELSFERNLSSTKALDTNHYYLFSI